MEKKSKLTLNNFKKKLLGNFGETVVEDDVQSVETEDATRKDGQLNDNDSSKVISSVKDTLKNTVKADNYSNDRDINRAITTSRAKTPDQVNKHLISNEDYKAILKYMQAHYLKCFPLNYNDLVPLAVGIHKELFNIPDLPFAKIKIRRFLVRYTRQRAYRNTLIVGRDRMGLDGTVTSKVLEAEINKDEWKKVKAARPKADKATHDRLIKKALENPAVAQEFLELYLPQEYKELIDLSTVNPEKETYVEDSLKTKLSDMVFSVQLKTDKINKDTQQKDHKDKEYQDTTEDRSAFVYCMIEHQSSSDYMIAFRLLKYSLLLLERHAVKRNKLPIVLPLVLYNGKKRYSAPKNIFELFSHPEAARKVMTEDYRLIDLQAVSDEDINYDKHLSFLLYVMKHIHDRDTLSMLKVAMERCNRAIIIDRKQNYILTKLILWYTDSKVALEKKQVLEQLITDNLPKEDTGNIMKTIAQSYIDEGYNKGITQGLEQGKSIGIQEGKSIGIQEGKSIGIQEGKSIGIQEGKSIGIQEGEVRGIEKAALNMLAQNLTPELISQYTGLTVKQIKGLKETTGRSKKTLH